MTLNHKTIAILTADDGIERVELEEPRRALEREGARVVHITPSGGRARTFEQTEPAEHVRADTTIESCDPSTFDALVLPGGYVNPDLLPCTPSAFVEHELVDSQVGSAQALDQGHRADRGPQCRRCGGHR
jgi:protease I